MKLIPEWVLKGQKFLHAYSPFTGTHDLIYRCPEAPGHKSLAFPSIIEEEVMENPSFFLNLNSPEDRLRETLLETCSK